MIDLGARLTVALARPLGKLLEISPDEIREDVTQPETPTGVAVAAFMRALAWSMAAGIALGLYVLIMIVHDVFDLGDTAIAEYGGLPVTGCAVVGVIAAVKGVFAWYVSHRWWRRSRVVRWLGTPGNADIVAVVLVWALGVAVL